MNKINKTVRLLIVITVLGVIAFIIINRTEASGEVSVVKWDNLYNENNIIFYYSDKNDEKIKALNNLFTIDESVSNIEDKLEKAIKVSENLKTIMTHDVVSNSKGINAFDIIREKKGYTTASGRDLAIIYRDFLESVGITARVGEFRRTNASERNQKSYFVVEFWSEKYSKWIMIDFIDEGYFDNQGFPCSALEVLESNIEALSYNGKSDIGKFSWRKENANILDSLYTYTIAVDNSTTMKKSNTYITYVKDIEDIVLQYQGQYINPTIYTQNKDLMNINPIDLTISNDEKAYIVLMKKQDNKQEQNSNNFIIAGFKNSKVLDQYYLKVNDSEFIKVREYYDVTFTKGLNTIELSLDGENTLSKIELQYN